MKNSKVICIHIGARAHYLIPRSLQQKDVLCALVTETWVGNSLLRFLLARFPVTSIKSLAGRYTKNIPANKVYAFGFSFLLTELYLRIKYSYSWSLILRRDDAFQIRAVNEMKKIFDATTVFGISYTSLNCFREAKLKGLKTVLFQVDPGLKEEEIVRELVKLNHQSTSWEPAPKKYWEDWTQECMLADIIMVNSEWSKTGLLEKGIEEQKIRIIPLPFDLQKNHFAFTRKTPDQFVTERPLRCLFLGTLAVRKGIHLVIDAAKALEGLPVEFIFVGRSEIDEALLQRANISYKGIVTREETDKYYQESDVFLFPTLSDGFGLTQLEAMAWKLPVIASKKCGDVVQNNHNGWLIDVDDSRQLIDTLRTIVMNTAALHAHAANCISTVELFNTDKFASDLVDIV